MPCAAGLARARPCLIIIMTTFESALDDALAVLRKRLVADASSKSLGGTAQGGIRATWREQVRRLARLRGATADTAQRPASGPAQR
jgi:hypothetical protein